MTWCAAIPGWKKAVVWPAAALDRERNAGVSMERWKSTLSDRRAAKIERCAKAYEARESGMTWADIGLLLGVGRERARQLAAIHDMHSRRWDQ